MKFEIEWHHVENMMPKKNEYVLIETRFCKYPYITGYFNGLNWINCDDKTILMNIKYWSKIKTPNFYFESEIIKGNK